MPWSNKKKPLTTDVDLHYAFKELKDKGYKSIFLELNQPISSPLNEAESTILDQTVHRLQTIDQSLGKHGPLSGCFLGHEPEAEAESYAEDIVINIVAGFETIDQSLDKHVPLSGCFSRHDQIGTT